MSSLLTPDLCIVGDSAGGLRAALLAAAFGVPTILIRTGASDEKRMMQLSTWAAAAAAAHQIGQASYFGIRTHQADLDWNALISRLSDHSRIITTRFSDARLSALGIRVIKADPQFESTRILRAGEYRIAARRFILALDTHAAALNGDENAHPLLFTPETLDQLTTRPQKMVVIGDNADALTYAQSFARLGIATSLIAPGQVLANEDPEQVAILTAAIQRDGVAIHAERSAIALRRENNVLRLMFSGERPDHNDNNNHIEEADAVLNCMRAPSGLDQLGLAIAGIGAGPEGIIVDANLRTSNRAVFAVGDCVSVRCPGQGLAAARAQADCVMRQILFRWPLRYDAARIPRMCSTDPSFAAIGLTESEARQRHGAISVLRSPMAENDLAMAYGDVEGHAKILLDRRGRLLGASLTGAGARELISAWTALLGQKPAPLRQTVPPSPSFAETPRRALLEAYAPPARSKAIRALIAFLRKFG